MSAISRSTLAQVTTVTMLSVTLGFVFYQSAKINNSNFRNLRGDVTTPISNCIIYPRPDTGCPAGTFQPGDWLGCYYDIGTPCETWQQQEGYCDAAGGCSQYFWGFDDTCIGGCEHYTNQAGGPFDTRETCEVARRQKCFSSSVSSLACIPDDTTYCYNGYETCCGPGVESDIGAPGTGVCEGVSTGGVPRICAYPTHLVCNTCGDGVCDGNESATACVPNDDGSGCDGAITCPDDCL